MMFWKVAALSAWALVVLHFVQTSFVQDRPYALLLCENRTVEHLTANTDHEELNGCTSKPYTTVSRADCKNAGQVAEWMLTIEPVTELFEDFSVHRFVWECVPKDTIKDERSTATNGR
jgi:hypothetical protein